MKLSKFMISGLLATICCVAAYAQQTPPNADAIRSESLTIERPILGTDSDGGLGAIGPSYKARFNGGADFMPYFGAGQERNYPVSFRLQALRSGGTTIELATATTAQVGAQAVIHHGAIDEIYEARKEGLEQMFVLSGPLGQGALEVEIGVTSEMTASAGANGIEFTADAGVVRYGKAIVIDAAGKTAAVEETLSEGAIRLSISAEVLAGLTYPITIDPVISSGNPNPSLSYNVVGVDVACLLGADGFDHWIAVMETEFSATDHDVFFRMLDQNGAPAPVAIETIDFTTNDWRHARVASSGLGQNYLVVAARKNTGQPLTEIVGRIVHLAGTVDATQIYVNNPGDFLNPDVGGDPVGTRYFIVYESIYSTTDHDIFGRRVFYTGASSTVVDNYTIDYSTENHINPVISKSNCNSNSHLGKWSIIWEDADTFGDHDLKGVQIDAFGNQGAQFVVNSSGLDTTNPSVSSPADGLPDHYMVAYQRTVTGGTDVGVTLMAGSVPVTGFTSLYGAQGSAFSSSRNTPVVESSGCAWTLMYRTIGSGIVALGNGIEAQTILMSESGQTLFPIPAIGIAGGLSFNSSPALATSWGAGSTSHRELFGWSTGVLSGSNVANVMLYDLPIGQSIVNRVAMKTDELDIQLYGNASPGQSIAVGLCNSGPFSVLVLGVPGAVTYHFGLPVGVDLNLSPIVINGPFFATTLPMNVNLIGFTFAIQGADQSGNGFLGYRVSDTLEITIQ